MFSPEITVYDILYVVTVLLCALCLFVGYRIGCKRSQYTQGVRDGRRLERMERRALLNQE